MTTIEDLTTELTREAEATRRVLERVPEGSLEWRPHERSLSLGQLAMHVATLPRAIAELAAQETFDATAPIPRPGASSVKQLVATLDDSVARALEVLGAMDDASLADRWRGMAGDREVFVMTRRDALRYVLLNHWYHHRGQLTVYLRLTGAPVPATYGPSADER